MMELGLETGVQVLTCRGMAYSKVRESLNPSARVRTRTPLYGSAPAPGAAAG